MTAPPRIISLRTSNLRAQALFFLVACLFAFPIFCWGTEPLPAVGDEWSPVRTDQGLEIYEQKLEDVRVKAVLARKVIPLPPWRVWRAMMDFEHFSEFMPYVEETRVVEEVLDGFYLFQKLDLPWPIGNRCFTLRFHLTLPEEPVGHYRQAWAPGMEKHSAGDCGVVPPVNEGYYDFLPVSDGQATLVTYMLKNDPGGKIPKFAIQMGNKKGIPGLFEAMEKHAQLEHFAAVPEAVEAHPRSSTKEDSP